jgi:hypothetical protein
MLGDKANDEVCLQGWNQHFLLLPMKLVIAILISQNPKWRKSQDEVKRNLTFQKFKGNFFLSFLSQGSF